MAADGAMIACPECDLLAGLPSVLPGQQARCGRCGFVLMVRHAAPFNRALAFSIAGLVMLGISLAFPFLSISASGVENSMTLIQTVSYLSDYGAEAIAVLVFIFVILTPLFMLLWMSLLSISLAVGIFHPAMMPPTRWLFHVHSWSMVEVFAIGVIVSLVKLAHMARVEIGVSFWGYLAFTVFFLLAFSSLDRLTVWERIEELRSRKAGRS